MAEGRHWGTTLGWAALATVLAELVVGVVESYLKLKLGSMSLGSL